MRADVGPGRIAAADQTSTAVTAWMTTADAFAAHASTSATFQRDDAIGAALFAYANALMIANMSATRAQRDAAAAFATWVLDNHADHPHAAIATQLRAQSAQ